MKYSFNTQSERRYYSKTVISFAICFLILLMLSCDLIASTSNQSLEQTKAAVDIQMTVVAQQSEQNLQATNQAGLITQAAMDVQSTIMSNQATQIAQAPAETQPPSPQTTEPPPLVTETPPESDIEEEIKNAKILLFEDMAGTGELEYVQKALENAGYTFKDDGSAEGWFKDDLLSSEDWDLIIAASEWRDKIQGEYFSYLLDHINRGTAVIIEHWNLDDLSLGKVASILARCGVAVQKDWYVQTSGVPNLSVFPLIPDHPVFNEPNSGFSLRGFANFWSDDTDKGDLLKIKGGDAKLLTGTIATSKMDHGTLVDCIGGRVIIQTHSSHEYKMENIIALWQNMIHYTLKNHFLYRP